MRHRSPGGGPYARPEPFSIFNFQFQFAPRLLFGDDDTLALESDLER